MKFCPKCDIRLRRNTSDFSIICPQCGYTEKSSSKTVEIKKDEAKPEIKVLDENDQKESLSTIKIDCEKCGNDEAVWWMLQTRSADEPTTQFYRCTKCNNTWRNYA